MRSEDCNVRVDDPHTTFEAIVEVSLTATTSEDLGFDDNIFTACVRLC